MCRANGDLFPCRRVSSRAKGLGHPVAPVYGCGCGCVCVGGWVGGDTPYTVHTYLLDHYWRHRAGEGKVYLRVDIAGANPSLSQLCVPHCENGQSSNERAFLLPTPANRRITTLHSQAGEEGPGIHRWFPVHCFLGRDPAGPTGNRHTQTGAKFGNRERARRCQWSAACYCPRASVYLGK